MERVVITGYGIISALGNNVDIFWKNIAEGKSGIKLIEDPEFSDIPTRIAAYIESFDAEKYMNKKANLILSPNKPIYEPDITNCDNSKILNLFPNLEFNIDKR